MARGKASIDALGAEIEAEHQAAYRDARRALEHAVSCGRLLSEAKAALTHGDWLPWLERNTTMSPRQAQRYMRLGRHPELTAKCDMETHLTMTHALTRLSAPKAPSPPVIPETWEEWEARASQLLDGPFAPEDFDADAHGWLTTKLLHQAGVPAVPAVLMSLADEYKLPALRLAPYDELVEAIRIMAPHATGTAPAWPIAPGFTDLGLRNTLVTFSLLAKRIFVRFSDEAEHQGRASDEQLERERERVQARLRAALDEAWRALVAMPAEAR